MEMQPSFGLFANLHQRNDEEMSSFDSSGFASGFSSFSTSASSTASCSPFHSSFASPLDSSVSSSFSPPVPSASSPSRLRDWKNRKQRDGKDTNPMRARRDELVARFRGISLSEADDDGSSGTQWGWDDCVNESWGETKSETKSETKTETKSTPWYVFDDSLTWDQFLELSERDRRDRGREYFQNEMMHDMEVGDDYYKDNPWLIKTEVPLDPLVNTPNPQDMMCPACLHFALIVKFETLVCTVCLKYYPMPACSNIFAMKQGIKRFEERHARQCFKSSASYGIYKGDIAIICDHCQLMYNASKDL